MQKAVLITGCSSGIGLIAAQDLRNRGYRVLAACRKPQDVENMRQLGLEGIELIWTTAPASSAPPPR